MPGSGWPPPLLLVDVDGVVSLFGFDRHAPPAGRGVLIDGHPHWLSTEAAEVLRALAGVFDIAWCTGWEERAPEQLPGLLGLPASWPYVPLSPATTAGAPLMRPGRSVAGHWKLAAIDAYAGRRRPLAWIDDGLDAACSSWAAERPGPTLLVPTDPATGLEPSHAERLRAWASGL